MSTQQRIQRLREFSIGGGPYVGLDGDVAALLSGHDRLVQDSDRLETLLKTWHIDATGDTPVFGCFVSYIEDCDDPRKAIDAARNRP